MDILVSNFDKILSLGFNCYPKLALTYSGQFTETQLFDYTGCAMWSICQLMKNDYKGLTDVRNFINLKIHSDKKQTIPTNKTYYIRFPHDLHDVDIEKKNEELHRCKVGLHGHKTTLMFNNIQKRLFTKTYNDTMSQIHNMKVEMQMCLQKYQRRIVRFKEILTQSKKIVFVRYEEPMDNRILYPEYSKHYRRSEYSYIVEFSTLVQTLYPELHFVILYLSKTMDNKNDADHRIVVLKDMNFDKSHLNILNILEHHRAFLQECI